MRNESCPHLFATQPGGRNLGLALLCAAALALQACGGGGGGGSSPAPGGGGGVGGGSGTVSSFFLSATTGDALGPNLTAVNPITGATTPLATGNAWANLATIGEWTPGTGNNSGTATAAGVRFRVYADANHALQRVDLGSSPPVTTQLSSLMTTSVCSSSAPLALTDYASPSNSLLVFRMPSTGGTCGNGTDPFTVVPLLPSTAATSSSLIEPVEAVRDASGAIQQVLVIDHSISPARVGVANWTGKVGPITPIADLVGLGLNTLGGDFHSLALVQQSDGSTVWIYYDQLKVVAVNLKTPGSPAVVFTAADTDTLQLPVLVEGTIVYLAMSDTTNHSLVNPLAYTCQIVGIDTKAIATGSAVVALQEDTMGSGLTLAGIVGLNLVYFNDNPVGAASGTVALESIPTASVGLTAPAATVSTQTNPAVFDGGTPPLKVGTLLYFSVISNSGIPQTYFTDGITATALATANGSKLVGGIPASPITTNNPAAPIYTSAIVANLAAASTTTNPYSGAAVSSYGSGGTSTLNYGTLPVLQSAVPPGGTVAVGDTYTGINLSEGPLQVGMPALLELSGNSYHSGNTKYDVFLITPGTANSLLQITSNLQ